MWGQLICSEAFSGPKIAVTRDISPEWSCFSLSLMMYIFSNLTKVKVYSMVVWVTCILHFAVLWHDCLSRFSRHPSSHIDKIKRTFFFFLLVLRTLKSTFLTSQCILFVSSGVTYSHVVHYIHGTLSYNWKFVHVDHLSPFLSNHKSDLFSVSFLWLLPLLLDSTCKWDCEIFVWLVSLSIILSGSIDFVADGRVSSFFMVE